MPSTPHPGLVRRDFKPVSPEEVMKRRYSVRRLVCSADRPPVLEPGEMVHDEFVLQLCFSALH